ncbi:glucose 1-dehydrogenase [Streptomyces celluloflavus]|uniref:glucose 1-dehydrogenase n=1 Tax=Streptomyces celluloflavus TaxID=58344 RepID=UPI0036A28EC3
MAGRVALVTGGASGIGRACALAFARAGAAVAVADIDDAAAERTVADIHAAGGSAVAQTCDVTSPDQTNNAVVRTVELFGRLDCAVNSAGVNEASPATADLTEHTWARLWSVNVKGMWLSMRAEITYMLTRGDGALVNLASTLSHVAMRNSAAYVATKHAVLGLTRAAALDYATSGIRINAVCPGPVETAMMHTALNNDPDAMEQLRNTAPTGRFTSPDEVASGVLWLCTPGASHVLGHGLVIDGGWTAM